MAILKIRQPAADGAIFAPTAFADQMGENVPLTAKLSADCRLIEAVVADDGRSVLMTLDVPDEAFSRPWDWAL